MTENNNGKVEFYDNSLNIAELLRLYIKKWMILLPISVLVAVIVFSYLKFSYNKAQRFYYTTFVFDFPGIEDELYLDGTTFQYTDFISEENIERAVASNPDLFGDLNPEKIAKNKAVRIEQNFMVNKDKESVFDGTYTLKLHRSSFGGAEQAEAFAKALLEGIREKVKEKANQAYYQTYIDSYLVADTFEDKLDFLKAQQSYMVSIYDLWIEEYGEQYAIEGKTLLSYKEDVNLSMSSSAYDALNYELKKRQYVLNTIDNQDVICKLQIELLNDEYDDNKLKIENLAAALAMLREGEVVQPSDITGASNETYYYQKIAELTERQVDILREIKNIETKINNINLKDEVSLYCSKMDVVQNKLVANAVVLEKKVAPTIYSEKTNYYFKSSFAVKGGFSSVIGSGVAFIAVYLLVGLYIFILNSDKKQNEQ